LAIATGILTAQEARGESDLTGIVAPNGMDESHKRGTTSWTAMVGDESVFAMDANVGITPELPACDKLLAGLKNSGSQLSNDLRYHLNAATANQAGSGAGAYHRRRTALSIIYREILGPSLR